MRIKDGADQRLARWLKALREPGSLPRSFRQPATPEEAVPAAFALFGLDYRNPQHQRLLLVAFIDIIFGGMRGAGREREWTYEKRCQLLNDIDFVKQDDPDKPDSEACRILLKDTPGRNGKRRFAGRYHGMRYGALRRRLQDAKSPTRNPELVQVIEDSVVAGVMQRRRERGDGELDEQDEAKLRAKIRNAIPDILHLD
jgi:hypothetical protein